MAYDACLASFVQHYESFVLACCCNIFIYIAYYIPLCEYTTIYLLMDIWIPSNFQLLANSDAMGVLACLFRIHVHTFLLGILSRNEILGS